MEKQISIIIPTYNMEKYIGKCLDSLMIPEFDEVEVLVVNDGSKDRSSEIAHSYADRYLDSIRVIDKPNGNYGSCINAALPLATGRYVKVLDADDSFDTSAFSKFIKELRNCNEDAVLTTFRFINEDGEVTRIVDTVFSAKGVETASCNFDEVENTQFSIYNQMHLLSYNRSIFERFDYHQTEGISYTDTEWAIIPLSFCKTARFININLYRYLFGRPGQTTTEEQMRKSISHFGKVAYDLAYYFNKEGKNSLNFHFLENQIYLYHAYFYDLICKMDIPDRYTLLKKHDEDLRNLAPSIYARIGSIKYDDLVSYCKYEDIRKKGYPADFSVPLRVKMQLSFKTKFSKLFK